MNQASPPRGGRPALLSSERIVAAAVGIIDADGLEALTMRRLGTELGVAAMSLYRHLPNRDAVLAAVVNSLVGEAVADSEPGAAVAHLEPGAVVADLEPGPDWPAALTGFANAYRRMLLDHPHAVVLLATHPVDLQLGTPLLAPVLDRFAAAGVGQAESLTAVRSVAVYVLGHALAEVGRPRGAELVEAEPDEAAAAYYEDWFQVGLGAMVRGLRERLRPPG